jgi:hypothetical protein
MLIGCGAPSRARGRRQATALMAALGLFAGQAAVAAPPTPESHFGHPMGVDRKLLDWDKVVAYFQALAKTSDRIRVEELGKSTGGRPFIAAWISSPANIKNLSRYQDIQAKLADPRKITRTEADALAREGKAVVMITCSIHSTEVASTHTAVEFAYKLLTEDRPKYRAILDNVILILVPSLNPDGVDIVTQWYRKALGSQWEGTNPPELYHKYVGHDNNRDWYIFSQVETQLTVSKLHNVWHPEIVYDVHQQGAYASRIFVPPWMDPIDPNIDPIIAQLCNSIGAGMAADLTAAGRTGVAINAMYDFWSPSRHYQAYHGGLRILSESASARLATPITVKAEDIQSSAAGYNPRERSWNYLQPWLGGTWRLRDIIEDQLIAWESCLYQAALRREDLLRAFYEVGVRASHRERPYAFVIPFEQNDPGSASRMLSTLAFGQIEIEQALADFTAGGKEYKKGSYVIRMQQPYSSWAKTLLERQHYPDLRQYPGGPPKRPYDVTAQTLPLLMGVATDEIEAPFTAQLREAREFPFQIDQARVASGALPSSDIEVYRIINSTWNSTPEIFFDRAGGNFYLIPPPGRSDLKPLPRPRIAIYKSFVPNIDEGWTRWLFDKFGFRYAEIDNTDMAVPTLVSYDAVIFPDASATSMVEGYRPGQMPQQYVGGIGDAAGAALRQFAEKGGTVIFLNHSTDWALDHMGLKIKNVVRGVSSRDFYAPGSILRSTLDTKHPLTAGLPEEISIWSEGSPAWDVPPGAGRVVARYPERNLLASGWLLGERFLAGRASLVDIPAGAGHILLFGMRPQYRGQSYQTFHLLFNSLLLSRM